MNERIVRALHKKNLDKLSLISIKEMVVTSVWNRYQNLKAKLFGETEPKVMAKVDGEKKDDGGWFDGVPDLPDMPEDDAAEPCVGLDCDYSLPEVEDPPE